MSPGAMKGNVYVVLRVEKSGSSIPHVRTEFNLWPVLREEQSQPSGRAGKVSVECSGPHRKWGSEIGTGYRMGLSLFY